MFVPPDFSANFENELSQEKVVLSRPERERLFRQSTKEILTGMIVKIDQSR